MSRSDLPVSVRAFILGMMLSSLVACKATVITRVGYGSQASKPTPTPSASPSASPSPQPSPVPSPSPSSTGTSGGSGSFGLKPGAATRLQLDPNDIKSRFYIYVPPSYVQGSPIGMVMLFHGVEGTADPNGFFRLAMYYANDDRFILVAPSGDVNDGGSGAWCQPFAREIMEAVRGQFNIDDRKQYMAAVSGGVYPGMFFGLASKPATYTNYCGQTVRAGFQSDFAAVGFMSPAYAPNMGEFSKAVFENKQQLGFTPAFWADYGELSSDGGRATALSNLANNLGYAPNSLVVRPGEKHAPQSPYSYAKKMFDLFESHPKK